MNYDRQQNSVDADLPVDMIDSARAASAFLKAISNETRLMILCHLMSSERSVTELERLLCARQATVSQHLGRLKRDNLVAARRSGKAIFYSISDPDVSSLIRVLHQKFCDDS